MCDSADELRERANEKYGDDDDFVELTTVDHIGIGFINTIHNMDVATAQEIQDAVKRICREHGYPAD
jgi:hypothetical protein